MSLVLISRKLACMVASQALLRSSLASVITYATRAKVSVAPRGTPLNVVKVGSAQVTKRAASPAKKGKKPAGQPKKVVAAAAKPKKGTVAGAAKSKPKAKAAVKPKAKTVKAAGKGLKAGKKVTTTKKVVGNKGKTAKTPTKKPTAAKTAAKKVKKAAKKAAAPKKAVAKQPQRSTPYQLFMKDNFASAQGATPGEKLKALAAQWKSLPADAKNKYVQRSQSDDGLKKRRITGMALYVKENYAKTQSLSKLVEEWKSLSKEQQEKYNQRAHKGEGSKVMMKKPKGSETKPKTVSGYAAFIKETYPTLQGSLVERSRLAAAKWKALSDQQKQAYRSPAKPAKPSKRLSGYNLYSQEQAKQNKLAFGAIATQWKAMTDAQREVYKVKAKGL